MGLLVSAANAQVSGQFGQKNIDNAVAQGILGDLPARISISGRTDAGFNPVADAQAEMAARMAETRGCVDCSGSPGRRMLFSSSVRCCP